MVHSPEIPFLLDTGASKSSLNKPLTPISKQNATVVGAPGKPQKCQFLEPLTVSFGQFSMDHSFLYVPNCPMALLGKDVLFKMRTLLELDGHQIKVSVPSDQAWRMMLQLDAGPKNWPEEIENRVKPLVWAGEVPGKARWVKPEVIQLKSGAQPVSIKQYPMWKEAKEGLQLLIDKFLKYGLLKPAKSPFNTPKGVKMPDDSYWLVQDLRTINAITEDLYQIVSNPYTILTGVRQTDQCFTVLDLKYAFFSIGLAEESQDLFAFQWSNGQLKWAVLPQVHKSSPTFFS